jgi:hydroxymethylpyrimidine/phosphomethylpyrimidine kinase
MTGNQRLSKKDFLLTAQAFRLGQEAAANQLLTASIDKLAPAMTAVAPRNLAELSQLLQQTLNAQARQDVIGLADLLQYELLPRLLTLHLIDEA